VTEDRVSTNPLKKAPERSITHGLANLAEEMSVESRDLSHGLSQGQVAFRGIPDRRVFPSFRSSPQSCMAENSRGAVITYRLGARRPWVPAETGCIMGDNGWLSDVHY